MKKAKGISRLPKAFPGHGPNGDSGKNGASSLGKARRRGFRHPKTAIEAAVQRYVDLYEFAPIPYVSFDRVGRVEEANLAAAQLLARARRWLVGSPFPLCVVSDDAGLFLNHLLRCRSSEGRVETELRLRKRGGEVIFAQLSSTPTTSSMRDGALLYQTAIIDLSERKRSEDAIRQSHERYRTLFDFVPAAVYSCDADGWIHEFNQRAVELWGRVPSTSGRREKFCGSFKILYPDGRRMPHKKCPMARALRGETLAANDLEIVVEREDGVRRIVAVNPSVLRDDRGQIIGAINCLHDITERKASEQSLTEAARRQESLYQFVKRNHEAKSEDDIHNAALGAIISTLGCDRASILIVDSDGVMRFVAWQGLSERYRRAAEGHSPWGPDTKNPRPICIADINSADFPASLKAAIKSEGIGAAVFIPLLMEGKLIGKFMMYYNAPHVFTGGETTVARNIAGQLALGIERKRGEGALRESEALYRAFFSQTEVGMARSDLRGRLMFVNRKLCEILGYDESELVGKTIGELTHREYVNETRKLFRGLLEGKPYDLEKPYVRKDGSLVWVRVSASPIRDAEGKTQAAVAVIADISERKKAESALESAKRLLERRVEERTRELVVVIEQLQDEIARRRGLEGEIIEISDRERRRMARDLHDGVCQHLAAVALMSRAGATRLKAKGLPEGDEMENISKLINQAAGDTRDVARGLHLIDVNSVNFMQALRELVDEKFWLTPCRLEVQQPIALDQDEKAPHLLRLLREAVVNANKHARATQIVVEAGRRKGSQMVSVTDNGVGLPRRTNSSKGMGFHLMDYRARYIGGRLEISSPPEGGTRIACYLPRSK